MKNKLFIKFCFLFLIISLFGVYYFQTPHVESVLSAVTGSFTKIFQEKYSPEDLKNKYANTHSKIKILIVPGHDNLSVGAQYKNIKEADINIELAYNVLDFFKKDNKFIAYTIREKKGSYSEWFLNYTNKNNAAIKIFRGYLRSVTAFLTKRGDISKQVQVEHNPAADNTSLNLYAINKFANENNIDIVIHIHFNDYPGRKWGRPGEYTGFSIYIPEKQLPNHRVSADLAQSIKQRLEKYFAKSNFPGEAKTDSIIEDQELIAIGSNASMQKAAVLIEYGYIYESQFVHPQARAIIFKSMAEQTYLGIKDFFVGAGD